MTPDDEITMGTDAVKSALRERNVWVVDMGGASAQGATRSRNEDAWGYTAGSVFVVADGMGGRSAGDVAARATVDSLIAELVDDVADWRESIGRVNNAVRRAAMASGVTSCGSAAVALRCRGDRVTVVHVGDARAYRLRGDTIQQLTQDHSVAVAMTALGLRRSEVGLPTRELSALTSFFGSTGSASEFSVHELSVQPGDRIVLTTDGIHDSITLADWIRASQSDTCGEVAEALTQAALSAGATDDRTALVIELSIDSDRAVLEIDR